MEESLPIIFTFFKYRFDSIEVSHPPPTPKLNVEVFLCNPFRVEKSLPVARSPVEHSNIELGGRGG